MSCRVKEVMWCGVRCGFARFGPLPPSVVCDGWCLCLFGGGLVLVSCWERLWFGVGRRYKGYKGVAVWRNPYGDITQAKVVGGK